MELITVKAASLKLGLSRTRVRQLIHAGRIVAQKVGRDYLIDDEALAAFELHGRKPRGRPRKKNLAQD